LFIWRGNQQAARHKEVISVAYIVVALIGMAGGAFCVFMILEAQRKKLREQKEEQQARSEALQSAAEALRLKTEAYEEELARFKAAEAALASSVVPYRELQDENAILKRDLHNLDVHVRKLKLDHELQRKTQETLDLKIDDLGSRYLKDNVKWLSSSLNPHNFANCKQRLQDVIDRCRGIGLKVPAPYESLMHTELREEYQKVVRAAFEREEQARIKAQIREEQMRQREIERELAQLEREREAIKVALEKALADARGRHSEEVERLKARLTEAEEKSKRAVSQAQLTKSGHVYVISNIGSFGEGVFKVRSTRRLDPSERVRELGSASVPFPFDVHMMISSNDAPTLEYALQRKLFRLRINKANPRKEFFKTDIATIARVVKEHHGDIEYIADAEALQYRQSLEMSDEDQEFVESVYSGLEEDDDAILDDV
jgi:predicted nuclease with TOPRIM domain